MNSNNLVNKADECEQSSKQVVFNFLPIHLSKLMNAVNPENNAHE